MLTNQAFEAIIDFLSNTESADITSENFIPWDDAALLFLALSEPYFKELRGNLLNLNREDASLYLCEAIESLSRFSNLILPANDEIDALLALQEKHKTLGLVIEQAYSEALKEAFTVVCREELPKGLTEAINFTEALRSATAKTEFKVDLGTEFFRGEELALRRDFRIELHRRFSNGSFNPDTMPEDGWAWIYAEQVSFFLESIWLRVIELYERRCGTAPEALHWHSYSQWVKQHSQETEQLAASEAILIALLTYGDDKPIEAILIELAYDADESVLASNTTFNAGKTDYSAPIDTADAPATTEPQQPVAASSGVNATKPQQKQENLSEMLCGGYKPDQLLKVIGSDGLGLYDAFRKQPNDTATPTNWAMLYWGLQYKGFLPEGISNAKAVELLRNTFGATTSKTRIGDVKPDLSQNPQSGTYLARVVDLLSRLPA